MYVEESFILVCHALQARNCKSSEIRFQKCYKFNKGGNEYGSTKQKWRSECGDGASSYNGNA
ncbi:MAG: hypothetical protein K9G11_04035, partial [Rickettsiaceae bacterium]|nr:hypothetical protein [Rickettsiaceae bacterium]